ncbi:MAG: HD-GYP domain-containing protein [Kosmotoga sp.]|nr:MAG: HD-GYP domain-containing protein [Kosmotoga sp.]
MIYLLFENKKNMELISELLKHKYEVEYLEEIIVRENIDLIICDYLLYEKKKNRLQRLKRNSYRYIPLILLLNSKIDEHEENKLSQEVDHIWHIPLSKSKFLSNVKNVLSIKESFKEIEERYEALIKTNQLGIFIQNENGIAFSNEKLNEFLPEIENCKYFQELVSSEQKNKLSEYLSEIGTSKEKHGDFVEIKIQNNDEKWIMFIATKITYKNVPAIQGIVLDISRRKKVEKDLFETAQSLKESFERSISLINKIVRKRDPYTATHQQKVRELSIEIARKMNLPEETIEVIDKAAILHDIGKIFVPSEILNKPGQLTEFEMRMIKQHPVYSYELIKEVNLDLSIANTVLQHHERLNGTGYPEGLKENEITLEAKILAVADVVEAMSSHRPYRPALGIDHALEEIRSNKSTLYDPAIVDACLEIFESGFSFSE